MLKKLLIVFSRTLCVFNFLMFSFLHVSMSSSFFIFVSSGFRFFRCFYFWLLAQVQQIWESVFYSKALFTLYSFPTFRKDQGFPGDSSSPLKAAGLPTEVPKQTQLIPLFDSLSVLQLNMFCKLFRTLFKFVKRYWYVICAKSLINFKYIIIW